MAMGVGLCAGPLMGSLVYAFLNYVQTFYLFSGYVFYTGLLAIFMIPSKVNKSNQGSFAEEDGLTQGITYKEIASNKRAVMATLLCTLSMLCILYMDPILSVRLTDLGMNEKNVGYCFALIGIAFGLGGPSAGYLC